ncbi:zinc-ribbon domain-containing protein [Microbacterium aurum]|nr:zinc-ribbon domain-containing protein [Microbacterium aurum]MBM7827708.1 hypothetical protein [Microbacterium aurum]
MLLEAVGTLAVRVRPARYETLASYERRLRVANGYTDRAWNVAVNEAVRMSGSPSRAAVIEQFSQLRGDHFERYDNADHPHPGGQRCGDCEWNLTERYACVLCTRGDFVEQRPHDGARICNRHMRWVGPRTRPEDQFAVDLATLRADREYRQLRRTGHIDATKLSEVVACVEAWASASSEPMNDAQMFRAAIAMTRGLVRSGLLEDAAMSAKTRRGMLESVCAFAVRGSNINVLVDAVALLLRADRLAGPHRAHALHRGETLAASDAPEDTVELTSSFYPRVRHLQLTQLVAVRQPGDRFIQAERLDREADYVCPKGHQFSSTGRVLRNSKSSGGCGYCARKKVAPETSLAATHPHLKASWHPTKNGDVQPEDVLAGTGDEYFWLCDEGHTFKTSPNARTTSGTGCGYCANILVDESNCLRTTHPHLAVDLNDEANDGVTADNVVAGSELVLAWICPLGHDYWTAPVYRAGGSNCHVCTHQVVHPTTCLAATHPEIAAMWHDTLNGDRTPYDVFAGSMEKAWFDCGEGHAYDGAIVSRVKGVGCRYCSNRAVCESNSMRVTRPDLAAQLHPTKNGAHTPDTLVAGTSHKLWWLCKLGHDWEVSGDNRVRQGTGCPYCSNKKVWPGYNDMATTRPDLAAELHPTLNGSIGADSVVAGTGKRLHWLCPCGHVWPATGDARANRGRGCAKCKKLRK